MSYRRIAAGVDIGSGRGFAVGVVVGSGRGVVVVGVAVGVVVGVAVELTAFGVVAHWAVAEHIRFAAAESFVDLLRR